MGKTKSYCVHQEFVDANGEKHTVLVYGELELAKVNAKGRKVQLKCLNFGHAICSHDDTFDVNVGINIAKKRLYRDPLCSLNHNFLNEDMVMAILKNEIKYIIEHLDKYLPKTKEV